MKYLFLLCATFLLCSCALYSQTSYKPWSSDQIQKGEGGAVTNIGPYEFWEFGAPQKEFRVLGVIEQTSRDSVGARILLGSYNQGEIIKNIEAAKGDGVIQVGEERYVSGYRAQPNYGTPGSYNVSPKVNRSASLLVFRYVGQEETSLAGQ